MELKQLRDFSRTPQRFHRFTSPSRTVVKTGPFLFTSRQNLTSSEPVGVGSDKSLLRLDLKIRFFKTTEFKVNAKANVSNKKKIPQFKTVIWVQGLFEGSATLSQSFMKNTVFTPKFSSISSTSDSNLSQKQVFKVEKQQAESVGDDIEKKVCNFCLRTMNSFGVEYAHWLWTGCQIWFGGNDILLVKWLQDDLTEQ